MPVQVLSHQIKITIHEVKNLEIMHTQIYILKINYFPLENNARKRSELRVTCHPPCNRAMTLEMS